MSWGLKEVKHAQSRPWGGSAAASHWLGMEDGVGEWRGLEHGGPSHDKGLEPAVSEWLKNK